MSVPFMSLGGDGSQEGAPYPIRQTRAPTTEDRVDSIGAPYVPGQVWVDITTASSYMYSTGGVWIVTGGSSSDVNTLSGDTGTATPILGNIQIVGGTGISTVGAAGTVTLNVTGQGTEFTTVTADTLMVVNNGYITNKAGTAANMTLPVTAAVGSSLEVIGRGATGWVVAQNASQTIHMNSVSTTTGTGGSLASSAQFNTVTLICTVANTDWTVVASQGVLTVT